MDSKSVEGQKTQGNQRLLEDPEEVPWLSQSYVHMKNPAKVVEKINSIIKGGKEKLQVIFDYDRTLTKYHVNGVPTISTYGILESLPTVSKEVQEKIKKTVAFYLPIELDPKLSVEEKIPFMVEWWNQSIEDFKGVELDPKLLDQHTKENKQPLRDGTKECLEQLRSAEVPVLVFSAGSGEVVTLSLQHEGLLTPNLHIVSNFYKIEDGKVTGCQGDIIHVFNKNERFVENTPYYKELSGRTNVILLGDSIGDSQMADGVPHDTVLKIGFLNTQIEDSLAQYTEKFDIVLADDQSMDVLLHILKLTLNTL